MSGTANRPPMKNQLHMDDDITTMAEAARILGAPQTALVLLCRDGKIPARRIGGTVLVSLRATHEALKARQQRKKA